jgi:predicted transposase YdaD
VRAYLDESSLVFLDKEFFTDPGTGKKREADIVVRAKWRGEDSFFIINIEGQGRDIKGFQERFFWYSIYLYQKYHVPVYPIVVFYDKYPATEQPEVYRVGFPDLPVFEFHYRVIQLHKLDWREYVQQPNPVAAALVARMKMAREDRPWAKLESLQTLVTLGLDTELEHLISSFIDTYLELDEQEEEIFQQALGQIEPEKQEEVMELTTSWMRKGIELGRHEGIATGRHEGIAVGRHEGRREEALSFVLRLLKRRLGTLTASELGQIEQLPLAQLEELGEALLDFTNAGDLAQWLTQQV